MSPFNLATCARPNILALEPYRCARDDYADDGHNVLLDANENAYGPPLDADTAAAALEDAAAAGTGGAPKIDLLGLHRYPDPHQRELKQLLCDLRNDGSSSDGPPLTPDHLFVGVGSDEAIDALLRAFCHPGRDTILVCPPTYGMYSVSAAVNDVGLVRVPLLPAPGFQIDVPAVLAALDDAERNHVKLVYLCSPGNPTGALLAPADVERVLAHPTFNGLVVLDEAYVDFAQTTGPDGSSRAASLAPWTARYPNLVVLQTLSKAFGLAGIRVGAAFCASEVARLLNSLKAPYNVSAPASALAAHALRPAGLAAARRNAARLLGQRDRLAAELPRIPGVGRLRGGTNANFLLYEMLGPDGAPDNVTALAVYEALAERRHVIVRFRGREHGCLGCLRITVGTEEENTRFLEALRETLAQVRGTGAPAPGKEEEKKREEAANGVVA